MASDQPGEIQDCYESRPAQSPGHGGRFYPLDVFHCLVFLRRTDASGRFSPGEAKNIASTVTAHFDKGSPGQEETPPAEFVSHLQGRNERRGRDPSRP